MVTPSDAFRKTDGKSLIKKLNKVGLRLLPCCTPMFDENKGVSLSLHLTHDLVGNICS